MLSDTDRRAIENAMADLREALKGNDATLITTKASVLQQVATKLGEAVYAQSQNPSAAAPAFAVSRLTRPATSRPWYAEQHRVGHGTFLES